MVMSEIFRQNLPCSKSHKIIISMGETIDKPVWLLAHICQITYKALESMAYQKAIVLNIFLINVIRISENVITG